MNYLKHDTLFYFLKHIISFPFIVSILFPLIILDLWIEIYHRIGFILYDLPFVPRNKYIKIDRYKLSYLTLMQKFYCVYCGYANGLFAYWVAIAGETEKYWCGVQHQKDQTFIPPQHHRYFAKFNDVNDFNKKYKNQ